MIKDFFRKDLREFRPYNAEGNNLNIKMDANESFLDFPEKLKIKYLEVVQATLLNRYPDPSSKEVCRLYADYAKVRPENVAAGNGSDELIQIVVNAFISSGDRVMVLDPDFSMYSIYTQIAGGIPVKYDLDEEFKLDEEDLISSINSQKIKILFLSNPNNPTGGVIPKEVILKIVKECKCIVVIDEAYYEFYGSSVVDSINDFENLIVLRTCSKALGLAGLRLGFLITNDNLMYEIKKVKPPYNVNSITQKIGEVVLKNPYFIDNNIKLILRERDYLVSVLRAQDGIKVYDTEANFILIKTEKAAQIRESASAKGISIRCFNSERLKNCIRICCGKREENEAFLKSII